MRKSFETPRPITARLAIASGRIEARSEDTRETVLEIEALNEAAERILDEVRIELRDSRLVVETPEHRGSFGRSPEFDLTLSYPTGSSLEVRTASADLHSVGRLGGLDVNTASGDVEAEGADGETRIRTASGDVELGTCRGPVELHSVSGDVSIDRAASGLRATLVSGDLRASAVDGGAELNSVSGDLTLEAVGPGALRARTVSGDVEVGVQPGCAVWMDVKSLSGDTSSDLKSEDGPPEDRSRLVEIEVNSTSGDVHIGRASAARVGGARP